MYAHILELSNVVIQVFCVVWLACWRQGEESHDTRLHAAEEMFSLHARIETSRHFMEGDVGADSCRKTVKKRLRRQYRRRDVRERRRKSCLYEKFVDLTLS